MDKGPKLNILLNPWCSESNLQRMQTSVWDYSLSFPGGGKLKPGSLPSPLQVFFEEHNNLRTKPLGIGRFHWKGEEHIQKGIFHRYRHNRSSRSFFALKNAVKVEIASLISRLFKQKLRAASRNNLQLRLWRQMQYLRRVGFLLCQDQVYIAN